MGTTPPLSCQRAILDGPVVLDSPRESLNQPGVGWMRLYQRAPVRDRELVEREWRGADVGPEREVGSLGGLGSLPVADTDARHGALSGGQVQTKPDQRVLARRLDHVN